MIFSCGRWADAYLPPNYSQTDVQEALQELVWKATQFDNTEDEFGPFFDPMPEQSNRPSRSEFFRKLY